MIIDIIFLLSKTCSICRNATNVTQKQNVEAIPCLLTATVRTALCSSILTFSCTFTRKTAARISSADFGRWLREKIGKIAGHKLIRERNICWLNSKLVQSSPFVTLGCSWINITVNFRQRLKNHSCNKMMFNPQIISLLFQFALTIRNKDPRSHSTCTHTDKGALCLGPLGLGSGGALVSGSSAVWPSHSSRGTVCADSCSRSGLSRSLLDAVQEAYEEDVAGEFVHGTLDQRPALWAAQLSTWAEDALETAATKGVLTGKDLCRGVQPLETDGALEQIQQYRFIHSLLLLQQKDMMLMMWFLRGRSTSTVTSLP